MKTRHKSSPGAPRDDHDIDQAAYIRPADWIPPEVLGRASAGAARMDQAEAILASAFGRRSLQRLWAKFPPDATVLRASIDPDGPTALLLDTLILQDGTDRARVLQARLQILRSLNTSRTTDS